MLLDTVEEKTLYNKIHRTAIVAKLTVTNTATKQRNSSDTNVKNLVSETQNTDYTFD